MARQKNAHRRSSVRAPTRSKKRGARPTRASQTHPQDTSLLRRVREMLSPRRVWALAREVGFVKRARKINPFVLVCTLVLGFGPGRHRTISSLRRSYERAARTTVVPSSFYDRLGKPLVVLLRRLADHLMAPLVAPGMKLPGALAPFTAVAIADASVIRLHERLAKYFPGSRTNHSTAAVKLHAVVGATAQSSHAVAITGERKNERTVLRIGPWVRARLLLLDLGYFGYRLFDRIDRNGGFFISRLKANANPVIASANRLWRGRAVKVVGKPLQDVLGRLRRQVLDVNIDVRFARRTYAGKTGRGTERFRVVAVRNPSTRGYHLYITNVPPRMLTAQQVALAYSARWQVELMFRAWKSDFRLDEVASRSKEIAEVLLYASIITMFLTQRLLAWLRLRAAEEGRRISLHRLAAVLRQVSSDLLYAITGSAASRDLLRFIEHEVLDPHRRRPTLIERAAGHTLEAA